MRVLLMMDPREPGYANRSGVHKYFYELVAAAPDDVEYRFVNGDNHEGTKTRRDRLGDNHEDTKTQRGMGRFLPLSVRLMLGYSRDIVRMARLLRPYRDQVDLLHVVAGGCEIAPIAARLAGFRHVVDTVQAMFGEEPGADHWVRRLVEWLCFRCSNYHVFVSDATRVAWENRLKRSFPESCMIYNGMQPVDLSDFDRMAYRRQFVEDPEGCFIVGICARLHHMKGHRVLIEAFASLCGLEPRRHEDTKLLDSGGEALADPPLLKLRRTWAQRTQGGGAKSGEWGVGSEECLPSTVYPLRSTGSNFILLIAGEGPERGVIERQIAGLPQNVAERIRLVGHREDPCIFTACLDLHVMASTSLETIGYANIEAMFAGVPCIVSDVGGAKEIVRGSGGGIVVPAGDVNELAAAMSVYIGDRQRCAEDGGKGRDYAQRVLTSDVMVKRTIGVYERVAVGVNHKDTKTRKG